MQREFSPRLCLRPTRSDDAIPIYRVQRRAIDRACAYSRSQRDAWLTEISPAYVARTLAHRRGHRDRTRLQGLNLILLASPLFLYNLPVLDDAEFATQKNDIDVETRKVNYQNTITTRAQYEQCMCFGVLTAYRGLTTYLDKLVQKSLPYKRVSDAASELIKRVQQCGGVNHPTDLKIPGRTSGTIAIDRCPARWIR